MLPFCDRFQKSVIPMIPPFTAVPALPILPPITRNHGNHNEKWLSIRTLLVVTTGNLEQIALEFITERVTGNLFHSKKTPISLSFHLYRPSFLGVVVGYSYQGN